MRDRQIDRQIDKNVTDPEDLREIAVLQVEHRKSEQHVKIMKLNKSPILIIN